jgi:hypothetical protein
MVAFCVKDSENDDAMALNTIKNLVREPAEQQTTKAVVVNGPAFGDLPRAAEGSGPLYREIGPPDRNAGFRTTIVLRSNPPLRLDG